MPSSVIYDTPDLILFADRQFVSRKGDLSEAGLLS